VTPPETSSRPKQRTASSSAAKWRDPCILLASEALRAAPDREPAITQIPVKPQKLAKTRNRQERRTDSHRKKSADKVLPGRYT
jgi:hypothetical protein